MAQKIMIEPVTRIEGHAKVGVYLDDQGQVEKAVFHVNEFRGFEKFCEGRMFFEMPLITERICGICPVSHHLASGQGVRPDHRRGRAAAGQPAARADAHGADHPVPLDARLRAGRTGPAARLRLRSQGAQRGRPVRRQPGTDGQGDRAAQVRPGDHRPAGRPPRPSELRRARRREPGPVRRGPRCHAGRDRRRDRRHPGSAWASSRAGSRRTTRTWASSASSPRTTSAWWTRTTPCNSTTARSGSWTSSGSSSTASTAGNTWTTSPSTSSPGPI